MNISISQYRARVGGYYSTAYRLSTKFIYFKDVRNVIAFLLFLNYGTNGVSMALYLHFCPHTVDVFETCTGTNSLGMAGRQSKYSTIELLQEDNYIFVKPFLFVSTIIAALTLSILLLQCGDVHPNPGPIEIESKLSVVHNNIRSLPNKTLFIEAELNSFDIITLSETWLHDNIPNENLHIKGYLPPIRRDRPENVGHGGVAIYVKEDLICKHRPDLEVQDLEAVWVETKVNQDTLLIGCFYRPPDSRVGYWDLIDDSINKAGRTPHKLLILGDFNTDINLVPSRHLSRIMHQNNLVQLIKELDTQTIRPL